MLDPSGTLSRFSQVLKIISRLVYFNFPFGQKLVIFLEHAESMSGVDKVTGDEEIKLSRVGTRAKLTRYKVGVEVMNTIYTWKTGLYAFSGLVTLILGIYRLYRRETHKYVLYLMYVWPRVHLILFNYTIVDISFMATRVLLHSRLGLHCFYSLILLCMIFFDICRIIQLALNDRLWKLIYKQKAEEDARLCPRTVSPQNIKDPLFIRQEIVSPTNPRNKFSSESDYLRQRRNSSKSNILSLNVHAFGQSVSHKSFKKLDAQEHVVTGKVFLSKKEDKTSPMLLKPRVKPPSSTKIKETLNFATMTPKIDYEKTYDELDTNHHLVSVSSSSLMISEQVYMSTACRFHLIVHSFRIGFYQLFMVSGQSCPSLVSVFIVLLETTKAVRSIYLYWTLKYLKSKILLALDLSQSIYMSLFFSIFLFSPLNNYLPTSEAQGFAIWLVILTCLTEYVLMIIFIAISAVDAVKRLLLIRNMKKRGEYVEPPHAFLRYSNEKTAKPGDSTAMDLTKWKVPASLQSVNPLSVAEASMSFPQSAVTSPIHVQPPKHSNKVQAATKLRVVQHRVSAMGDALVQNNGAEHAGPMANPSAALSTGIFPSANMDLMLQSSSRNLESSKNLLVTRPRLSRLSHRGSIAAFPGLPISSESISNKSGKNNQNIKNDDKEKDLISPDRSHRDSRLGSHDGLEPNDGSNLLPRHKLSMDSSSQNKK